MDAGIARSGSHALSKRCFATLEVEGLAQHRVATHTEARLTVFRYIERWYNPHRRHSALGQQSPLAFERSHAVQSIAA
ncbi:IS3 family transposase [Gemmatimonas sp.]|jgi:putative transposase|uniref:IS3 family transposase n=1 Tax=Gemmatimonas sp. TaxID=1962908 RepID=UPI0022C38787|nr:IS3 family transposase [Gemmatimonas sp.]MCZ8205056.1 IS3 family transposase [Gemmatimonas sp.]